MKWKMGFGMGFGIWDLGWDLGFGKWDGIWGWDGNGIWDLGWDGMGLGFGTNGNWDSPIPNIMGGKYICTFSG